MPWSEADGRVFHNGSIVICIGLFYLYVKHGTTVEIIFAVNFTVMLKNYLTIAVRNLARTKAYSFINILGLTLGISCCLLLTLYVQDEVGYDTHHARYEDVYRINTHFDVPRYGLDKISTVSPPIATVSKNEIPEIEVAARLFPLPMNLIKYEDKMLYEDGGKIADSTIFEVLTYSFIEGSPKSALKDPNTIVITSKLAKKIFGDQPALNKILSITQDSLAINFKVTGVIKDNPKSHFHPTYFISLASEGSAFVMRSERLNTEWAGIQFVTAYVKLVNGHNKDAVVKKMNELLVRHGSEDMKALGFTKKLALQPISDIYLKSDVQQSSRIKYLYIVISIALFILTIACINFMNLSTARATRRAAEFGVRKVMGAPRGAIIRQILGEALIHTLIAIFLSVSLLQLILPPFNAFVGKEISVGNDNMLFTTVSLITIAVVTSLMAGSYPAFYFSRFQPVKVLKSKLTLGNASGWLRQSLVVFQFMISIVLVCGMIIMSRQLNYLQQKDLGFNAEAKIILPLRTVDAKAGYKTLQKRLTEHPSILEVSAAEYMPGTMIIRDMPFYPQGGGMEKSVAHKRNYVDSNFQDLLDIKLIAGRKFTDQLASEQNKVILNRAAADALGFGIESAVGHKIQSEFQGKKSEYEVIGVMENYHQTSLRDAILPMLFEMPPQESEYYSFLIARVSVHNFEEAIGVVEKSWKQLVNDAPFEYSFLDEKIQKQYDADRKVSGIIKVFTVIAMLISCLGLYGLSNYMAERRVKEIGVRKVLGATVNQIVSMMSQEFIRLVIIAFIIAVPLAWYAMDKWLEGFAFKTSINVMVFVFAGMAALVIALATVSFESIKAARSNPACSLKSE